MATIQDSLATNAVRCLVAIHKLFFVWAVAGAGLIFLPSNDGEGTLKLPLFDVPVHYFLANTFLTVVMFAVGFVASEMLGQARSIANRLAGSEQLLAVLTYPSIATFRTGSSRFMVGALLVYLQILVGIVVATPKQGLILWPQCTFALVFSAPMMWFAYRLTRWISVDVDEISPEKPPTKT